VLVGLHIERLGVERLGKLMTAECCLSARSMIVWATFCLAGCATSMQ